MKNRSIVNRAYNTRSGKKEVQASLSQRNSMYDTRSKGKNSALSKHQESSSSKDSDKQSEEVVSDYEDELTQDESEDSVDGILASECTSRQSRRTSKQLRPIRNQSSTTEQSAEGSHIQQHIPVEPVQPPQTERTKTDNLEDSSARPSEKSKFRQRILDRHILRQAKVTMSPEDYSSYLRDVSNSPLHADGRKQQFVHKMNEMVSGKVGSFREELRKEVETLINSKSSELEKSMAKSVEQAFLEFQLGLD